MKLSFEEQLVKEMTKDITPKSTLLMTTALFGIAAIDIDNINGEATAKDCLSRCIQMCTCALIYMENNGFQIQKTEQRIKKTFGLEDKQFNDMVRIEIDKMIDSVPMMDEEAPVQ